MNRANTKPWVSFWVALISEETDLYVHMDVIVPGSCVIGQGLLMSILEHLLFHIVWVWLQSL